MTVRERAATQLATLLTGPHAPETRTALLAWTAGQRLESLSATGLLPFCHVRGTSGDFEVPVDDLLPVVKRPSLLSDLLLQDLGVEDGSLGDVAARHSGDAPVGFELPAFFVRYVRTFIGPIYSMWATAIERDFLLPFNRQWAFEWQRLVSEEAINPSYSPLYGMRRNEARYSIYHTRLSDVYLSSFLRALAWSVSTGRFEQPTARRIAAETCPVDLALWNVRPSRPPDWWPLATEQTDGIDTVPAQVWKRVSQLWEQQASRAEGDVILAASGRVHQGAAIYDLEILGVLQTVLGPQPGEPEELFESCWPLSQNIAGSPVRLEGEIRPVSINESALRSNDWGIVAASAWVRLSAANIWRWWQPTVRLPNPVLTHDRLTVRCDTTGVEVWDSTRLRARWTDWTDGVSEMVVGEIGPPAGYALTADSGLFRDFATTFRSSLMWLCRLTGHHRAREYQDFETFKLYREFGASRLIVPP